MGNIIVDTITLIFALVMVAIKHDEPASARVAIVADAKKVLADFPPGSTVAKLLTVVPDPVEDYLIGLAADTAISLITKTPLFTTGGSAS